MEASTRESDERALLQHAKWLRSLAVALVGEGGADDLTQETWVAALSSRVDASRPLRPWLRRVATNFSRRSFRGRARQAPHSPEEPEDSTALDPSELTVRLESEALLTEALSRLAEPFRTTLYLRFYEGLEPKAIATRTNTPDGTVRWRLKRGLELMRERLDARADGNRAHWMAAILPLAGLEAKQLATAAGTTLLSGSTTLFGVLAMGTLLKILATVTVGVALYVGLDAAGYLPSSLSLAGANGQAVEVEYHPLAVPPQLASSPTSMGSSKTSKNPATRTALTAPVGRARDLPQAELLRVTARIADEDGMPLEGVLVRENYTGSQAESDKAGQLVLPIDVAKLPAQELALTFSRTGKATRSMLFDPPDGLLHDLGEIRLQPGGVVTGIVRDEHGNPLADATVTWMEGETPGWQLREFRFQHMPSNSPTATTQSSGRFSLEGVPTGLLRISASAKAHEAQFTEPLLVREGYESRGIELVLPPLRPENRILVRVLDPAGAPVAFAKLNYEIFSKKSRRHQRGDRDADEHGKSEFVVESDAVMQISASDPEEKFGLAALRDVVSGSEPVTLQLTEARFATLTVLRGDQSVATEYTVEVRSTDGETLYDGRHEQPDPRGRMRVRLPSSPFQLRVEAPLAEIVTLGPLDPEQTTSLEATLRELPGLRGKLVSNGEPVEGGWVTLHKAVGSDVEYSVNGFRCGYEAGSIDAARSDADGQFCLTIRAAGEYVVRAEAPGFAPADTTPFTVGPDLRGVQLELELGRGGTLEGRVRESDEALDLIIGVSRGDGHARTMRVNRDGEFRFEGLTPGGWRVDTREVLLRAGAHETSSRTGGKIESYGSLAWDCEVLEGETTFYTLELGPAARWQFSGQLSINGATDKPWTAQLQPVGQFFAGSSSATALLDAEGRFSLPVEEPGRYQLALHGGWSESADYFLVQEVDSAADSPWTMDLRVGSLRVEGAPTSADRDVPPIAVLHALPGGGFLLIAFGGNEAGQAQLDCVPAGRSRLVEPVLEQTDPRQWPVLREIEVASGGSLQVKL